MHSQNIHIYVDLRNEKRTMTLQICIRKKVVELMMDCRHLREIIFLSLNEIERRR